MEKLRIIYDNAYRYAKRDGMSDKEAEQFAENEVQDYIDEQENEDDQDS